MITEEQVEIPLSKTKIILTFIGALILVGLRLWILITHPKSDHWLLGKSNNYCMVSL